VWQGAFITVLMGVPLFALAALVTGQVLRAGDLSLKSYALLACAGLVHYIGGRFFNYAALRAIGAARASTVQALGLPYSVLIALLFLGEAVTLGMWTGIALIMIGPLLMIERRAWAAVPATTAPVAAGAAVSTPLPVRPGEDGGFNLRQAEGYFFATMGAIGYGSSPIFIRAALAGESGLSVLGGLVSYIAAAAVLTAALVVPSRRELVQSLSLQAARPFFAGGFFVFLAQMLRFIALSLASVAVVATLLRFGSLFTLGLSWGLNRHLESITLRTVAGVLISLAGALLMVLTRAD
jgi:drug/metabolite transporter (DMT)-like permease